MAIEDILKRSEKIFVNKEKKIIYKRYNDEWRLRNEINAINHFKSMLNVPEIVKVGNNYFGYKYIEGKSLDRNAKEYFNEIENILKIIQNHFATNDLVRMNLKSIYNINNERLQEIKIDLKNLGIEKIIKAFKPNKDSYCHGDFRVENLILQKTKKKQNKSQSRIQQKNKQINQKIYVIDWENAGIGDRNVDLAYLFMSTNNDEEFLDYFKKDIDYDNFLYFAIFYSIASYLNPHNNQEFKEYIKKINKIIRNM